MVKQTISLTTNSVETTPMDVTPIIGVPIDWTLPPTAKALTKELLPTPKVPKSAADDT